MGPNPDPSLVPCLENSVNDFSYSLVPRVERFCEKAIQTLGKLILDFPAGEALK